MRAVPVWARAAGASLRRPLPSHSCSSTTGPWAVPAARARGAGGGGVGASPRRSEARTHSRSRARARRRRRARPPAHGPRGRVCFVCSGRLMLSWPCSTPCNAALDALFTFAGRFGLPVAPPCPLQFLPADTLQARLAPTRASNRRLRLAARCAGAKLGCPRHASSSTHPLQPCEQQGGCGKAGPALTHRAPLDRAGPWRPRRRCASTRRAPW